MSGFLPPIAAFQRMEKRTAWSGNGIPHLRRDPRSSEIHAPDARTEPSHLADRTIPVLSAIQNPTEKMMPAKRFLSLQALLIARQTSI
jgi:hypothetical protein